MKTIQYVLKAPTPFFLPNGTKWYIAKCSRSGRTRDYTQHKQNALTFDSRHDADAFKRKYYLKGWIVRK